MHDLPAWSSQTLLLLILLGEKLFVVSYLKVYPNVYKQPKNS